MEHIPSWVAALVASLLGGAVAWGMLRETVAQLKATVSKLEAVMPTVTTLVAEVKELRGEHERMRTQLQSSTTRTIELLERVAVLEGRLQGEEDE